MSTCDRDTHDAETVEAITLELYTHTQEDVKGLKP